MYKATANEKFTFDIDLNNPELKWDIEEWEPGKFNIIKGDASIEAELVEANWESKECVIKVNGQLYTIVIKDKMDLLLEKMGISNLNTSKVNEIKAPMPGLVIDINVSPGDSIEKGDAVLILEAMKMENVLKSPGEGVVQSIEVKQGEAVEKGQVLIKLG